MAGSGTLNNTRIEDFVELIYDAAFEPSAWETFVARLSDELPGVEPLFYFADSGTGLMEHLCVSDQWQQTLLQDYVAYYNAINPWTAALVSGPPAGQIFEATDLVSKTELEKSEFYNDFLVHHGDWSCFKGTVLARHDKVFSAFALHCNTTYHNKSGELLNKLMFDLLPHLQRAVSIAYALNSRAVLCDTTTETLEVLPHAALVVGEKLNVIATNRRADDLFSAQTLRIDPEGGIRSGLSGHATDELRKLLCLGLNGGAGAPVFVPVASDDVHNKTSLPLIAWALPWRQGSREPNKIYGKMFGSRFALLMLVDPAARTLPECDLLRTLFGLTPAESHLAIAIASGEELSAYASRAQVATGTARVQLKSIFSKTDTHRQTELALLMQRLGIPFGNLER